MSHSETKKKLLLAAMKNLMKQKDFSKIRVGEICDQCGINRKTFYYYFCDKYELMNKIYYEEFIQHTHFDTNDTCWTIFSSICRYFYTEPDVYRNALNVYGQNSFCEYFYETLAAFFYAIYPETAQEDEQQEKIITFCCDVFYAVIYRWLSEEVLTPVETFLKQVRSMIEKAFEYIKL